MTIRKTLTVALLALPLSFVNASAMECGPTFDKAFSAIGSMTTASAEKRQALRRMAVQGYDRCMAGDLTSAESFVKMIMSTATQK